MSKFGVKIGNTDVLRPGVYYDSDASAMVPQRGSNPRQMLVIAPAAGGATGEVLTLRTGDETRVLQSGVGAQMVGAAFRHGQSEVLFLSPTVATSASIDYGQIILDAINPGRPGRAIQTMTAASVNLKGAFDLFVRDPQNPAKPEAYRDLGPVLDVRYVGQGTPSLTVKRTNGVLEMAFSDGTNTMTIKGNQISSFADLAAILSASDVWTARPVGDLSFPIAALDATASFAFEDKSVLVGVGVNALAYVLRDSKLVKPRAGDPKTPLRLSHSYEFLDGGTDAPAPTTADWINAFRTAEALNVQGIVVGTSDPAVIVALEGHVMAMSAMKEKHERTAVFGAAAQPSKAAFMDNAIEQAGMFADCRLLTCVGNQPYDADLLTGVITEQPASVAAAATLALRFALNVEEPTTAKALRFPKWKYDFTTAEVDRLIDAGVMPVAFDNDAGRVIIAAGITTYTEDANTMHRKQAGVEIDLYIGRACRKVLFNMAIGEVADQAKMNAVLAAVKKFLDGEIRDGKNRRGVLTAGVNESGQPIAAYENLSLAFDGYDVVGIDVDAHPVGEIGYVRFSPRWSAVRLVAQ